MPATTMPADVAAAIRALVLPASLIENSSPLELCPCQYGTCQSCAKGRHKSCVHGKDAPRPPRPHTLITTAAGIVTNSRIGQVWTVGRPCQWVCTCLTCQHPRPSNLEVLAPGNPPARRRGVHEILALLTIDQAPTPAPVSGRRPGAPPRQQRPTPPTRTSLDTVALF